MSTIGERLAAAIERSRFRSKRDFHRELERVGGQRAVRGISYSTLYSYLSDKTEPSITFLELSAELLGVRPPWLITGQGEPTLAEQVGIGDSESDFGRGNSLGHGLRIDETTTKRLIVGESSIFLLSSLFPNQEIHEAISEEFERYSEIPFHSRTLVEGACWTILAHVLHEHASRKGLLADEEVKRLFRQVARVVGEMLQLPFRIGDTSSNVKGFRSEDLEDYAVLIVQALKFLFRTRSREV